VVDEVSGRFDSHDNSLFHWLNNISVSEISPVGQWSTLIM